MADGARPRASLSTVREAIKKVKGDIQAYDPTECDERTRDGALQFLEGLDLMVSGFCRPLTDDHETLDPCPRKKP